MDPQQRQLLELSYEALENGSSNLFGMVSKADIFYLSWHSIGHRQEYQYRGIHRLLHPRL